MSLLELVVYCGLAMLLLAALLALFTVGRRMFESSSGSYMLGQEIESGIRFLRQDLQETALSSVRVFRQADGGVGLSMASARSYDDPQHFLVSRYGVPQWTKHVYYALEAADDRTASLVRWETPDTVQAPLPVAGALQPWDALKDQKGSYKRVVVRNLLRPGVPVDGAGDDGHFKADAEYGGFGVSFVRQNESEEALCAINPVVVSSNEGGAVPIAKGNTRVIDTRLCGLLTKFQGSAPPSMYDISFRVSPRH